MQHDFGDAQQFWDQRYGEADRVWSIKANPRLVEVASALTPRHALDLGCGEGADALWLAEQGWQVVAVDVSPIALQRAANLADQRNVMYRIDFQQHDLCTSFPEGKFDLISVQYLHSTTCPARDTALRMAAGRVTPGGMLLIVDHKSPPPWSLHRGQELPSGEEILASLQLDTSQWQQVRLETVDRELVGPHGQVATIPDNVVALRRSA